MLLISCPCALGLATPIALVVASTNAAKNFILIKNPAALEKLALVKYAFFDKTGTLTKEKLSVFKHNLSKDDFDKLCQIESLSSHPIAKALHKDQICDLKGEGRVIVGSGIKYKEDSDIYLAGSAQFLHENEIDTKESDIFFDSFKEYVRVYFAKNKKCLGGVLLSNALKDEAKELVLNLKEQNLKTFILSGDHVKNVEKIAKELQIDEFYAQLKSEEKLQIIQKFEKTLFVGDGINDAAALSAASVSISFSKANELAKKTGDFILIKDDLSAIFKCFKLAKKTRSIIKLNLFWAFIYNVLCIPIAAGFVPFIALSPHIAALAMCFSSVTVVFNSLRLRKSKP